MCTFCRDVIHPSLAGISSLWRPENHFLVVKIMDAKQPIFIKNSSQIAFLEKFENKKNVVFTSFECCICCLQNVACKFTRTAATWKLSLV